MRAQLCVHLFSQSVIPVIAEKMSSQTQMFNFSTMSNGVARKWKNRLIEEHYKQDNGICFQKKISEQKILLLKN